jgi:hypothetical protein
MSPQSGRQIRGMTGETFGHLRQARGPGTYLVLGVGMALAYVAVTLQLSFLVLLVAAAGIGHALWRLVVNPARGFQLDSARVEYFDNSGPKIIPLDRIDSVSVDAARKGAASCALNLTGGEVLRLYGAEAFTPNRLMQEFGRRGIRVLQKA